MNPSPKTKGRGHLSAALAISLPVRGPAHLCLACSAGAFPWCGAGGDGLCAGGAGAEAAWCAGGGGGAGAGAAACAGGGGGAWCGAGSACGAGGGDGGAGLLAGAGASCFAGGG